MEEKKITAQVNEEPEQKEETTKKEVRITRNEYMPRMSAYERTRRAVYATGNRWAIENFHATHD